MIKDPKAEKALMQYEPVSKDTAAYTKILISIWEKLGKPTDAEGETGWKMLDNIIRVWATAYPQELQDFITENKNILSVERSVHQSVKAGGIMPVAYPERFFQMAKLFLPQLKLNDKEFYIKFIRRYPIFKTSNYA